ncbi:hypothetical protein, partial [Pseudoalteromonas sp. SIMBA_162]|uniref:hypothetical protein n=1 Tax=Pseudoalteromonas sp. SIMBA_162 TaxID=3080867 RepID=UPI00397A186E
IIADVSSVGNTFNLTPFLRDMHPKNIKSVAEELKAVASLTGAKISSDMLRDHQWIMDQVTYEWHKLDTCLPVLAEDENAELI